MGSVKEPIFIMGAEGTMAISSEHIEYFLQKAREITELYKQYVLPGDGTKKSVDDLRDVCCEYSGLPVNVHLVNVEPGYTLSSFHLYPDHCDIHIRAGMSEDWTRFALCKELFHLVADKEDCRSLDIYDHLEAMNTPALAELPNAAVWENLAEAAAMEFLFPYADREAILKRDPATPFELTAEQYGVPLVFVEQYLSDSAMKFFEPFRADGKAKKAAG